MLDKKLETEKEFKPAQPLVYYLERLNKEELKELAKFYGIKGYSNKKKNELVKQINEFIFNDFQAAETLFDNISVEVYNILNHLIISDNYSAPFDGSIAVTNLVFMHDGQANIPSDIKEYLRDFVIDKSGREEQDDEVILLVSAVNLYGYFSLKQYKDLMKKYLNVDTTEKELEDDLAGVATVQSNHVLNPLLNEMTFDGPIEIGNRMYYTPETWEEFKKFFAIEHYEITPEIAALFDYLEGYIVPGTNKKELHDSLVVMMKTIDNPKRLKDVIGDFVDENMLREMPDQPTLLLLNTAYRSVRNWHLGGYKLNELEEIRPAKRVINKEVRKKSKKRRKNTNVNTRKNK